MVTKVITRFQFTASAHDGVTATQRRLDLLDFPVSLSLWEIDPALADFSRQDRVIKTLAAEVGHGLHEGQYERMRMVLARSQLRLE